MGEWRGPISWVRPRCRLAAVLVAIVAIGSGCATIRVTDPPRTATEQFLLSEATDRAAEQFAADPLRDRKIFVDSSYLSHLAQMTPEHLYALASLRARLLVAGVRLVPKRDDAEVVLEVRSAGIGIDRLEFLLGIPSIYLPGAAGGAPLATPEVALIKSTRQRSFASLAYVAYWADSGELLDHSGPFVGKARREDWWFFGAGPRTVGNIAPVEP